MKKRYCPECGRSIPLDARICPYCAKMIPMHEGQIVEAPGEKKDKTVLIIVAVVVILLIVPIAIAATVYVYVSGMIGPGNICNPKITFTKTDTTSTEALTVNYVDTDVYWDDFTIFVDGGAVTDTLSGTVSVGDIIYFKPASNRNVGSAPPTKDYGVFIVYDSTKSCIYETSFVGN